MFKTSGVRGIKSLKVHEHNFQTKVGNIIISAKNVPIISQQLQISWSSTCPHSLYGRMTHFLIRVVRVFLPEKSNVRILKARKSWSTCFQKTGPERKLILPTYCSFLQCHSNQTSVIQSHGFWTRGKILKVKSKLGNLCACEPKN